jgi:hypothetical protein
MKDEVAVDEGLEARVRATLATVAARTPLDQLPLAEAAPSRRRGAGIARWVLVAAVLAAILGTAVVHTAGPRPPIRASAGDAAARFPEGFDLDTALPVYVGDGDERAVADEYLADRFDRAPTVTSLAVLGDRTTADAAWVLGGGTDGVIARGHLYLRRVAGRWAVIASTTDGVDLGAIVFDGTRLHGTVTSSNGNSLFADALDTEGRPVPDAPAPLGHPGAARRFGTAAGPSNGSLAISLSARQPVLLQVRLVGGTFLSLSEVRLDPPAFAPHHDFDACTSAAPEGKADGPFPAANRCALALQGQVVAAGAVEGWPWELVASDEPSGHWVTLRAADLEGVFRVKDDTGDGTALVNTIGACCRLHGRILVAGSLGRDVATLELADRQGVNVLSTATAEDRATRYRYAIASVPSEGADPVWSVTVITTDGNRHPQPDLQTGTLGG